MTLERVRRLYDVRYMYSLLNYLPLFLSIDDIAGDLKYIVNVTLAVTCKLFFRNHDVRKHF